MTRARFILSGLRHHWRSHLTVAIGLALSAAIMAGALAVGDSVRQSLVEIALSRLGSVEHALIGQDRFFRVALADEIAADTPSSVTVAPVLILRGMITAAASQRRVNAVNIIGVDSRFARLWPSDAENHAPFVLPKADEALLNDKLATDLGVQAGESILLYIENPDLISVDAPLSRTENPTAAARLLVPTLLTSAQFGDFSLQANQVSPRNVFVSIEWLQQKINRPARANLLLTAGSSSFSDSSTSDSTKNLTKTLAKHWNLQDAQLELTPTSPSQSLELRSNRIFLDDAVAQAAPTLDPQPLAIFTYFVNDLRVGDRSVSYSMVSGLGRLDSASPTPVFPTPLPPEIPRGQIVINQWLADQLAAKSDDSLEIKYFVIGRQRSLVEKTFRFTIASIIPLEGIAADSSLMPQFPGLARIDDCVNWEPGFPIETNRIRPEDEAYWDAHRGLPKAFISLADAQALWSNRFGSLTALRFGVSTAATTQSLSQTFQSRLQPRDFGLFFVDVRNPVLRATNPTTDFGSLFAGFSFFLIFSAILLSTLLFILSIDQRQREFGALRAIGWTAGAIRRIALTEALITASIAVIVGTFIGQFYTRMMIHGLNTIWHGAVRTTRLAYHADPAALMGGAFATLLLILLTIWLMLRRQLRLPPYQLLQAIPQDSAASHVTPRPRRFTAISFALALVAALACIILGALRHALATPVFFSAGFLMMIAAMLGVSLLFHYLAHSTSRNILTLSGLGLRSTARRSGRSLATIILLCTGTFLIIAVSANRRDAGAEALKRSSGTGGFQFYAVSTIPIPEDLNAPAGREAYGLDDLAHKGLHFIPLRTSEGEEASCLNLNRAQRPRVLGVDPASLDRLQAFSFASLAPGLASDHPWLALNTPLAANQVPAIVDQNTAMWSLGLGFGGTIPFTDDRNNEIQLKIVGLLKSSILQGSVIIAEDAFERHFPSVSGYKTFLIDASIAKPSGSDSQALSNNLEAALERRFETVGLDLTPAVRRLAEFQSVENTYLSIFLLLGGLGLALGCVGLGVVLMRNLIERRNELALLRAIGFTRGRIYRLIFIEHLWLLILGIALGLAAALVAVWPTVHARFGELPVATIAAMLLLILANGIFWISFAASLAIRGLIIHTLQGE